MNVCYHFQFFRSCALKVKSVLGWILLILLLLFRVCSLSRKANKCAAEEHCPLRLLGVPAEGLHDKIEGGMRLVPHFSNYPTWNLYRLFSNMSEAIFHFCSNCRHLNELSNFLSLDRAIIKIRILCLSSWWNSLQTGDHLNILMLPSVLNGKTSPGQDSHQQQAGDEKYISSKKPI